jgi:diaminopimelate decarboxylase/aspartate kinase
MPYVVLKFGGTSVSTAARWATIAAEAQARVEDGLRPLVVCSAISGVSNLLEQLVKEAPQGHHDATMRSIVGKHRALAAELGVPMDGIEADLEEITRLARGAALIREASPRLMARVMGAGEILSTRLGVAFLQARGLSASWLDARELLLAEPEPHVPDSRRILSATCRFDRDAALIERLDADPAKILVTQGFIARDRTGATVLLGRGGSDTSAAYFAAKLDAARCEIWTDVPGMYTANPRQVPQARLLRALQYDEAQEIASTGAKVLHPRCIAPVREHKIPLHIRCTERPSAEGTVITAQTASRGPQVKAIASRTGLTLVSMETAMMWQQVGFLADVFACFKAHGLSIDLVSTSESNVTVSLDPTANALDGEVLAALIAELSPRCQARVIGPCAAVSLVGQGIRALLHRLGPALAAFEEQRVHLVSQAASDLNLTFVVDQDQADKLVRTLHHLLFQGAEADPLFGPPMDGHEDVVPPVDATAWWRRGRARLLELADRTPLYVLDGATLDEAARDVKALPIDRALYAVKANPHPGIIARFAAAGLDFECVSPGEIERVRSAVPGIDPGRILFTPNFAPRREYEDALALGVHVTLDNLHPLVHWREAFAGRELFVRLDPGHGSGHHPHVNTAGAASKFGIHRGEIDALRELAAKADVKIVGLHAHVGSGIRTSDTWAEIAAFLVDVAGSFPDVRAVDLGGGLGVIEKPGQRALDLAAVAASLRTVKAAHPNLELWLEPGRFLVARAGVLVVRVTQTKTKGVVHYIGVNAGMNALIRPALYGAYHEIANLTRLDVPAAITANVVGPICESGDVLGHARRLPDTSEGDVLAIAVTGAYGRAMSSEYNLRSPPVEIIV